MIDRSHPLPVSRQAELRGLARSTVHYAPKSVSEGDLELSAASTRSIWNIRSRAAA